MTNADDTQNLPAELQARLDAAGVTDEAILEQALAPARLRSRPLRILAISPQAGISDSVRDEERAARMNALKPLIDGE